MSEEQEQLWHYLVDGQQAGPVTANQLQELAVNGTITPETNVWTEDLEEWTPAGNIAGLFPEQPAPTRAKLITGAAAQTAAPLGAAQPAVAAPVSAVQAPAQPVQQPVQGGFSLGGSLAGGPHLPSASPGLGVGLASAMEQRLQIRSIGALQAGVVFALLFAITTLLYALILIAFGGMLAGAAGDAEFLGAMAGAGAMLAIVGPIVSGIFGFFYGLIVALIYNLAAKMSGGIVIKVQSLQSW